MILWDYPEFPVLINARTQSEADPFPITRIGF